MSQVVKAIYENGLFRPLDPVELADHQAVSLIVQADAKGNVQRNGGGDDFDEQLATLLFDGPSLPANFSRADIYADHD